jgi:hypothetical protein
MLTMRDSVTPADLPVGADCYAGYVNGRYANLAAIEALFPTTPIVSIAVTARVRANMLDIEKGDADPDDFPTWASNEIQLGAWRPAGYASLSVWPEILADCARASIRREQIRIVTAHYTGKAHICGPTNCGASFTADGTQWADHGPLGNGHYDQSLLQDNFFAPHPAPPVQEDTDMPVVTRCTDPKQHDEILVTGVLDVPLWLESEVDVQAYAAVGKSVKLTPATFALLLARAVTK